MNRNNIILGYLPSWYGDLKYVKYKKLTHINYAFLQIDAKGGLLVIENEAKLQRLVSEASQYGVKVGIAVGGWNGGDDSCFEEMASSSIARSVLVENLLQFVEKYNLSGVDIDWEYPDVGVSSENYFLFMVELSRVLHDRGYYLTAAVVGYGEQGRGIKDEIFALVDFLNIMAYDMGEPHSSLAVAKNALCYWQERGLPREKGVLGVPFYGKEPYTAYGELVEKGLDNYNGDCIDGIFFNGRETIVAKCELAMRRCAGIMIWEVFQDSPTDYSLLDVIYQTLNFR